MGDENLSANPEPILQVLWCTGSNHRLADRATFAVANVSHLRRRAKRDDPERPQAAEGSAQMRHWQPQAFLKPLCLVLLRWVFLSRFSEAVRLADAPIRSAMLYDGGSDSPCRRRRT